IDKCFLANLAATSLWQATKLVGRHNVKDRDRSAAVSSLILSAMALHRLLGPNARLPGKDFRLWADPLGETRSWTEGGKTIAQKLESGAARKSVVLVLGRDWNATLG